MEAEGRQMDKEAGETEEGCKGRRQGVGEAERTFVLSQDGW